MPTLQEQINTASSGATIQHDTEFVGNLVINKPITIQGSGKIRTQNADPAVFIPPRTGPVTLKGLEICATEGWPEVFDIVRWGTWQTNQLADVPQGLTIDSCDIHGQPGQKIQRGIAANGANFVITNSKVREIHHEAEAQAIAAWNGPGPFKLWDCYLEASHIGLLFGGAETLIPNLIPSNIDIKRIHFFRPLTWRGVWPCKNHLEFKNAQNVTADGCVLENSWVSAQIGFSILATVRTNDGKNPWAAVKNLNLSNFHIKNCAGGFQLIGKDVNGGVGSDLAISNFLIELSPEMGSNGRLFQVQEFNNLKIDRIDANPSHTYLNILGAPVWGLSYTNSLLSQGEYGFFGDGDKPLSFYALDAKLSGNIVYGSIGSRPQLAGNGYTSVKPNPVPAGVGVDMAALLAAQQKPTTQPSPAPTPTPIPQPTPTPVVRELVSRPWPNDLASQDVLIKQLLIDGCQDFWAAPYTQGNKVNQQIRCWKVKQ